MGKSTLLELGLDLLGSFLSDHNELEAEKCPRDNSALEAEIEGLKLELESAKIERIEKARIVMVDEDDFFTMKKGKLVTVEDDFVAEVKVEINVEWQKAYEVLNGKAKEMVASRTVLIDSLEAMSLKLNRAEEKLENAIIPMVSDRIVSFKDEDEKANNLEAILLKSTLAIAKVGLDDGYAYCLVNDGTDNCHKFKGMILSCTDSEKVNEILVFDIKSVMEFGSMKDYFFVNPSAPVDFRELVAS